LTHGFGQPAPQLAQLLADAPQLAHGVLSAYNPKTDGYLAHGLFGWRRIVRARLAHNRTNRAHVRARGRLAER